MNGSFSSYPRAILHIDGDAFFASCEQAKDPNLKGKPVITGKERGIASSLSYEAKAKGVTRGMPLFEIKKLCPDAIILPSDYETYSLLSQRLYAIVRRYTPDVEEYGIDECFADLTGLRRIYHTSYETIAEKLKNDLCCELGFTFSIGLGPNKIVAKIASKWNKPSGLIAIPTYKINLYTAKLPVEKLWGIGPQTTALLNKYKIKTALDLAQRSESWVRSILSKPYYEIWQELNGQFIMPLNLSPKESYGSIQKFKTFTPPSKDKRFVFAQLSKNIENACMKARRYNLETNEVIFILRTQDFRHQGLSIKFSRPTSFPNEVINQLEGPFNKLFKKDTLYRATGIVLVKLKEINQHQPDLFCAHLKTEKLERVFNSMDKMRLKFGKHTLFLGSSHFAHKFSQHLGERGDESARKLELLKGETKRRRLGIPIMVAPNI